MAVSGALVTGANRGLGLEFVRQLTESSHEFSYIFAGCRDPTKATDLQELSAANKNVILLKLDVTNDDDIATAMEDVSRTLGDGGGISLLMNNAGIGSIEGHNHLHEQSRQDLMNHFNVNAVSALIVAKIFAPLLKKAKNAIIVNISTVLSSFGLNPQLGGLLMYPYRTSKAALNMVTHCLAEELQSEGITVVAMHPGWVQTDMGGAHASLSPKQSASDCLQVIGGLSLNDSGKFLNHKGELMEW